LFRFNQTGGQETVKKQVRIGAGEKRRITDVLLHPVEEHNFPGGFLQVVFRNVPTSGETADTGGEDRGETRADSGKESDLVGELEKELRFTKEQLQVNTEQYETSIEELRASNEELQSLNEELQSTTEELETSKEEIQSVNEELKMVNEELESKVKKLNRANSDMKNLMETTEIGILFVGNDLNLQLYTESATSLFNLIRSDIGRPLDHVTHRLDDEDLTRDVSRMLDTLTPVEKIVQSEKEWYMMRLRPYRNTEEEVDGAVISFMDITQIKQAQHTIVVRTRQQEAAASLGLYMLTNREMQKIMDKTVQVLHKELDVDYSRLMKLNAEDDTLVTKAGLGWEKEDLVDFSLSAAKKWDAGYALKTKKPVITTDYTSEDRFEQPPVFVELGIQSGMNVLIEGIGGSYGILSVYSKSPRTFEENEIAFIQLVANSLGGAIEWERSNQRLLEEIEQTRKLQHQIVKISTSERWEVGKYLHDNVAQNLVAAQMIFSSLDGKFKGKDGKEMDKLDQLLKKTIDDIRSLSHEMIPMDIKSKGLDYTLQHFAKHMQELFDLECTFKLDGSEKLIQNNYAATNLFNITREATKNAAMHGKATKVVIEITREGDHLKLAVKDNGNGLDDEYEHKDGMGINIMRHRAHLMSGSLEIERVSEKDGVLVTCLIPLTVLQAEDEQAISTSNR
ncbi:MAG: PAS domain-containing protein, partial [Balneolaceae bacterium]